MSSISSSTPPELVLLKTTGTISLFKIGSLSRPWSMATDKRQYLAQGALRAGCGNISSSQKRQVRFSENGTATWKILNFLVWADRQMYQLSPPIQCQGSQCDTVTVWFNRSGQSESYTLWPTVLEDHDSEKEYAVKLYQSYEVNRSNVRGSRTVIGSEFLPPEKMSFALSDNPEKLYTGTKSKLLACGWLEEGTKNALHAGLVVIDDSKNEGKFRVYMYGSPACYLSTNQQPTPTSVG